MKSIRLRKPRSAKALPCGSAIVAVLSVLALLSLLLVSMLLSVRMERSNAANRSASEQARLAAESGVSAASTLLLMVTSNRPAYLVGYCPESGNEDTPPALMIGATNLVSKSQMVPLMSSDLKSFLSFPKLPNDLLPNILEKRLSHDPDEAVDLNAPRLLGSEDTENAHGVIASTGHYPTLWQSIKDTEGKTIGRYAFVMTDESARLNPALHLGMPRNNSTNWENGPSDLSLTNSSGSLLTAKEAEFLKESAPIMLTDESYEMAFESPDDYQEKKSLLTRDSCQSPDLIPSGLTEGGLPKYNLNDLATNPAWGATPYLRALKIAEVIDKNLPKFKTRDASLSGKKGDPNLYLRRLACCMVDYISKDPGPTGPPGGEPSGRDLVPYVTQIGECCTRKDLTSNSTTIQSQFFAEVWNPTTSTIPPGGIAQLVISNRAVLHFGDSATTPFENYTGISAPLPAIRPNEFIVIPLPPRDQTWTSGNPINPKNVFPYWERGTNANANPNYHQSFMFYWNSKLVDRTRAPGISQGDTAGGLSHNAQTLSNALPQWQCFTLPTYSGKKGEATTEETIQQGDQRFVGDPWAGFLTAYKWSMSDYSNTLWKGINPSGPFKAGYLLDPAATWNTRDKIPVNPFTGSTPSNGQTPDMVPSPYIPGAKECQAPYVLRKGPMRSLGELGNIFEPAQVDDKGHAPMAGTPETLFCSGGGRTLRIGQPEFHYDDAAVDWDAEGKRATELLDLFTLNEGRPPDLNQFGTNAGTPGRINVNTASHAVLTALFNGIIVTSDTRFTNSMIEDEEADKLASLIEEKRPFSRLSDLRILTPKLANAKTFTPPLSTNVQGSSPPVADVFDRAREEAFGKAIGHCILQTRVFRIYALGESLNRSGKPNGRALMEGLLRLTPNSEGVLIPTLHDIRWY